MHDMNGSRILPQVTTPYVQAVEVLRGGQLVSPISTASMVSSRRVGWEGIALESFQNVPSSTLPEHEHPTHYLNLFISGQVRAEWKMDGRARNAEHGTGSLYLLPAGSRDQANWSGSSSRIVLVMEPRFLAGALDETAHLGDVELRPNWTFQDRHIERILRALHADLEDGSPAGPLFGQSLGVALAHYLIRRHAVHKVPAHEYQNGMPRARLNRVTDFMRQNCTREIRLWELADLAGMSPHYFCELFKKSTGVTPYQFLLRCRMERAKQLMRSPQLNIRQIAEATGFTNQSHFGKVFRRFVGVTPMQFRAG